MTEIDDRLVRLPESKKRAIAVGSLTYFTGKKCLKGHMGERYTSSANCVQCIEDARGKVFSKRKPRVSEENQDRAKSAIARGFTVYEPKDPCPKGHLLRFATSGNCVECSNESSARISHSRRWARIKKLYGVDVAWFEETLKSQRNRCKICEEELTQKTAHIDHCHETNRVRALLCGHCNRGIGLFKEDVSILNKAINYLRLQK